MSYQDLVGHLVVVWLSVQEKYIGVTGRIGNDLFIVDDDTVGTMLIPLELEKQLRIRPGETHTTDSGHTRSNAETPWDTVPTTLSSVLQRLSNTVVQTDGGVSDTTVAYLVDVKEDYVNTGVVPDGTVYFPIRHIHSIIPLDVAVRPEFTRWSHQQTVSLPNADHFAELLQSEVGNLLKLGGGGPEGSAGILREVSAGFVGIVDSPHKVVSIPMHHVKAFSRVGLVDWNTLGDVDDP